MINSKIITVVLPAYNAEKTLEQTYREIPFDIVDHVILVDDLSRDNTVEVAKNLGIKHIVTHMENKGYGGNQKSCYNKALELQSDIVVMLHPDYQYTPLLIHSMCYLIANGVYEVVLGSRILGKGAVREGMPIYKFIANRFLTLFQNLMLNQKLSEYHTGYRAFSGNVLKTIDYNLNSDDFIFDNQMLVQIHNKDIPIAEITCPTKYFDEASSINFIRSSKYGIQCILTSFIYLFHNMGIINSRLFKQNTDWYKDDNANFKKYSYLKKYSPQSK